MSRSVRNFQLLFQSMPMQVHRKVGGDQEKIKFQSLDWRKMKIRDKGRWTKRWTCKVLLSLNLVCLLGLTWFYRVTTINDNFRIVSKDMQHLAKHLRPEKCNFPRLNPFSQDILPLFSKPSRLNCAHKANPLGEIVFRQERGKRTLRKFVTEGMEDNVCCYRPIHRVDDDNSESENRCIEMKERVTKIPVEYEWVEVICIGREDYRDGFAFVDKKIEVEEWIAGADEAMGRIKGSKDENRVSVLIFGIDGTSHMNFLRTMPKSNAYLLQNLSAIVMNGYTKVAENTLPNVVPLLSGLSLEEFKDACVNHMESSENVHLDNCPFIWKTFSNNGYRTGFAEDDVEIGIFNMNWKHAFEQPPTHYYLRPFTKLMQKTHSSADGYCYGTRLSFKVLLDNLENFATAFKDSLYFHFTWATKLPHNNFNKLAHGDEPLLEFLKYMHKSGHLNKTVLVVMSDHGSRLDGIRKTSQGKVEDRMPLNYIVMPPWLVKRYPTAYSNLKNNSDKLTSPYDMHKTLLDLMDLERLDNLKPEFITIEDDLERRPLSLFDPIPHNRTCFEAGIPLHWCVCQGTGGGGKSTSVKNEDVQAAVQFSIDSMNYYLKGQSTCANIELYKVIDAFYINSGFSLGARNKNEVGLKIVRVSFETVPGHGMFEATVLRDESIGRWMLTEQVVRTNSYDSQSKCVQQEFKEFCYCV